MSETQSIRKRTGIVLGLLCFVASLFLSLPGINIARAEDEPVPATKPSPTTVAVGKDTEKPEVARGIYDPRNNDGPIVLNTRGYNYGPSRPRASPAETAPPMPQTPQTKSDK